MTALDGWNLDEGFLTHVLRQAEQADLVTLDVFDTALTRLVDSPADLFAAIERRLAETIGPAATGFAQAREDAERRARLVAHRLGREEIDLDAILAEIPRLLPPILPHLPLVRAAELETERRLLAGVPDILALVRRLQAAGRPFLFISDMYLPAAFIAEQLTAAGYSGWDRLLVSTETGLTKATGRQWDHLVGQHPGSTRILHVGDDEQADCLIPRTRGIEAILYARARSARRVGGTLRPSVLPFSLAQRDAVLRARSVPEDEPDMIGFWTGTGRVLGGIVIAGFVRWLEQQVRRHRIETLYFCARDGWLIQRAWRESGAGLRTGIADHYLAVSRRPLNLSCGYLESTPDRLSSALLGFLAGSDGHVTVRTALARAGLEDPALVLDMCARFGSLEVHLHWPDGTGRFEQVLQAHAATVHAALRPPHTALMSYLRQEGFGAGRIGLVDLGWHATMQRSLRTLVEAERGPISLHGFYYGLWTAALGNRYGAGPMDSAFASDFIEAERQNDLHGAVEILEELHGAPHGTVVSYRQDAGRWTPVHADSPREHAQYETITRHFQAGALDTVRELFQTGRAGTLDLQDITQDAVRAALGAVCLSPQGRELDAFGGLGHCSTFDHAAFLPLIPACPVDDEERRLLFRHCGWQVGAARRWLAEATPDRAVRLRDWLHRAMAQYGERTLRQLA